MSILDRFRLDGQVAVVTGAGKGIGRAIAIGLAEAGADVALAARTQSDLDEVADAIRKLGRRALPLATDATSPVALEALAAATVAEFGGLTIWVNNAGGIPDGTPRYLTRTSEENFDAQIALNLKAVWMGATVAARHMAAGGVWRAGQERTVWRGQGGGEQPDRHAGGRAGSADQGQRDRAGAGPDRKLRRLHGHRHPGKARGAAQGDRHSHGALWRSGRHLRGSRVHGVGSGRLGDRPVSLRHGRAVIERIR
jgi:NAD(P)-dependent dehydrogenase (short-subunit alcohol dehydrogenase family)